MMSQVGASEEEKQEVLLQSDRLFCQRWRWQVITSPPGATSRFGKVALLPPEERHPRQPEEDKG